MTAPMILISDLKTKKEFSQKTESHDNKMRENQISRVFGVLNDSEKHIKCEQMNYDRADTKFYHIQQKIKKGEKK